MVAIGTASEPASVAEKVRRFREALVDAAGDPLFSSLYRLVSQLVLAMTSSITGPQFWLNEVRGLQPIRQEIADALASRHASAAREAADRYSDATTEIVYGGFAATDANHGERIWAEVLRETSSGHSSR